nr:immunoglobulin light chain junction region [Macaca mulatta]MOW10364.1 immunoglobulin light chain junction region [Macaca mulatta]MOW12522.1 immunoglobulin light chain junction region [Macaca mulatta]
CQNYITSPFTF